MVGLGITKNNNPFKGRENITFKRNVTLENVINYYTQSVALSTCDLFEVK